MSQQWAAAAAAARILALGDSYTIGESVPVAAGWPMQLAEMLRARHVVVADPVIVARTGWTTDELLVGIDAARVGASYDLVTLLIGVNDQYRGRSVEDYRSRFHALLARALDLADSSAARVIVMSIPDWGASPFAAHRDSAAISAEIDAFNVAARAETTRAGARLVDITPISRSMSVESDLVGGDGLHPSALMYTAWARMLLPVVLDILGARLRSSATASNPE